MIKVVVACGGGIFTTSVVTDRLEEIMRKNKIRHTITPHKITEIPSITGEDLIVVTGKTSATNDEGIPVMIGISLFTGVGEEEFTEEFLAKVKEIEEQKGQNG
ncbi:MAG: PTS sorbitol IIB subunit [Eubacteriaceae bacterium]|jgi:PTS system galactitol-specific IIB component|nr:PTS sorbitol IIB subunit [Eubacteriaceae bacterium]